MPGSVFFCVAEDVLPENRRVLLCGIGMAAAFMGLGGAVMQIYQWRPILRTHHCLRRPSPNPRIVISLAASNALACTVVILGSVMMFLTPPPTLTHHVSHLITSLPPPAYNTMPPGPKPTSTPPHQQTHTLVLTTEHLHISDVIQQSKDPSYEMNSTTDLLTTHSYHNEWHPGQHCDSLNHIHGVPCAYQALGGNKHLIGIGLTIECLVHYLYGVTFMWTLMYSLDIYLQLSNIKICNTSTEAVCGTAYNISSWVFPAITTLTALCTLLLGSYDINTVCPVVAAVAWHYVLNLLPLIVALVAAPIFYIRSRKLVSLRMRESGLLDSHNQNIKSGLRYKFLSVIIIFIIIWLPNLVDLVVQLVAWSTHMTAIQMSVWYPVWALEAFLNPLQGLLNYFIYGRHLLLQQALYGENLAVSEQTPLLYHRTNKVKQLSSGASMSL